jgi:hypothetical protein
MERSTGRRGRGRHRGRGGRLRLRAGARGRHAGPQGPDDYRHDSARLVDHQHDGDGLDRDRDDHVSAGSVDDGAPDQYGSAAAAIPAARNTAFVESAAAASRHTEPGTFSGGNSEQLLVLLGALLRVSGRDRGGVCRELERRGREPARDGRNVGCRRRCGTYT